MTEAPDPAGWLTLTQAAARLSTTPKYVANRIREGHLEGVKRNGRLWASRAAVEQRLREKQTWVSHTEAAKIMQCSPATITRLVKEGRLTTRSIRGKASLERADVERVAQERQAEREERLAQMRKRESEARPPDDEHVWLDSEVVALMLGMTANNVRLLARQDKLPFVQHGRRRWFRRDLIEQKAAADSRSRKGV